MRESKNTAPEPTPQTEALARSLTIGRLVYYGHQPEDAERIADTVLDHAAMGCEFDGNHMHWDCYDEDGQSRHPQHDEVDETAEFVMWTLEAILASDWLATHDATVAAEAKAAGLRDVTHEEPIETGWYAYSGGAQTMIFHLRETGQWSVHLDNGSAHDCGWGYIEQALGVWDLVRLDLGGRGSAWARGFMTADPDADPIEVAQMNPYQTRPLPLAVPTPPAADPEPGQ